MPEPTPEPIYDIQPALLTDVAELAALFDAYRVFYGAVSAPLKTDAFVHGLITHGKTHFFLAREADGLPALGFVHLMPSINTVAMRPIWLLEDLYVVPSGRTERRRHSPHDPCGKFRPEDRSGTSHPRDRARQSRCPVSLPTSRLYKGGAFLVLPPNAGLAGAASAMAGGPIQAVLRLEWEEQMPVPCSRGALCPIFRPPPAGRGARRAVN